MYIHNMYQLLLEVGIQRFMNGLLVFAGVKSRQ